jgi:hypothetical protein
MTSTMTPTMTSTMTPTMTSTMTSTMTPTMTPINKSMFYVSDSLGYPIKFSLFKNNTLIIELDTNDDTLLYSGYYRLVV